MGRLRANREVRYVFWNGCIAHRGTLFLFLSQVFWQWSSISMKRCHLYSCVRCPAKRPHAADAQRANAVAAARSPPSGCRTLTSTGCSSICFFFPHPFLKISQYLLVGLPFSFWKPKASPELVSCPVGWEGVFGLVCTRLLAFVYNHSWSCLGYKLFYTA